MNNFILTIISFIFLCHVATAQTYRESPYALFGDKTPVLDIESRSDRAQWSIVVATSDSTLGTIEMYNARLTVIDVNGNIIAETAANPSSQAMFQSIDPKADEMPWISPYVYCFGNPIRFVDKTGLRPTEYEAALMAQIVYKQDLTNDCLPQDLSDGNWSISQFDSKITMNHTTWYENGLQSALFERTTEGITEYAYVYAGTNSFEDVLEDIAQILGVAPQYNSAIKNAKILSAELQSNELTFIGHSLGGGEAAAASLATGRAAITFNPAAVSPLTKLLQNLSNPSSITNYRAVPTNGIIGGCFINNLQDNCGMSAPGTTINIPLPIVNPFSAHSIRHMVNYFKNN